MKEKRSIVPHVLATIFVAFIGIMVYVYIEARNLNPVQLDEHGHVRGEKR